MNRTDVQFAEDIGDAAQVLAKIVRRGRRRFMRSPILRAAAERQIGIIGEAANKMSDELKTAHPELPLRDAYAMRNALVHGYGSVDHAIVWDVMESHVPDLVAKLSLVFPGLMSRGGLLRRLGRNVGGGLVAEGRRGNRALCGATTESGGVCSLPAPRFRRSCAAGHRR